MSVKRFSVFIVVLLLVAPIAMSVSASTREAPLNSVVVRYLARSGIVQEATGLDASGIMSALHDGSSVAQLIEANDVDIESVITSLVGEATEQINELKDAAISRLPEAISQQLDRRWHWRHQGRSPVFMSVFRKGEFPIETEEAGDGEVKEPAEEGTNLLALIEANGGDIDGLMADLFAEATTQINDFAAARIDGLEESLREQLNATYADHWRRRWRFGWPRLPFLNDS